ncbi:hypothetical protein A9R00_05240 [Oleispira antarctica]|uniref:Uncharacterized protein n=1 Tax=Oleispira antarctica TaxID=188908 RepID=A0A1Y5HTF5_OLEAN|nr:hypothetical protein A9R00_05240 [Oleispira antarctica]
MNANPALLSLSDIASQAHEKIQQDFEDINPVIGVMQGMRKMGIPADVMSIDCLASNKRILLVLHDELPEIVRYQFTFSDQDPSDDYQQLGSSEVTCEAVYGWIKEYFLVAR